MHAFDIHTAVDIVTLVLAVGSGFIGSYRRFSDRIASLETAQAKIEGVLKGAGLL